MKAGVGVGMHRPQRTRQRVVESREIQKTPLLRVLAGLPPHTYIYGVAGEVSLAHGLRLRATRVPRDMCGGIPGPFHIEVWGAGPDRAEARIQLGVAGYPDTGSCMGTG
jgi:hypothetical protein